MYHKNKKSDRALVLQLYESGTFQKFIKKEASERVKRPHLCITGFTQLQSMQAWLKENDDGLFNRFLVFAPRPEWVKWKNLVETAKLAKQQDHEKSLFDICKYIYEQHDEPQVN